VGIHAKYLAVSGVDGECNFHTHEGNPGDACASLLTMMGVFSNKDMYHGR